MNLAGYSTAGPRPINEDNYYVLDLAGLASFSEEISAFVMVSDGMGGHEGGDVASSLAVQAAEHYLGQLIEMSDSHLNQIALDVPLALKEIVRNANELILEEMKSRNNSGMGATFVGAFISSRKVWIAHVGDSRAYIIRRGQATQITKDHSAVGRLLSEGLITEREAQNHPERNVIERALGFTSEDPEISEVYFGRGDVLLLCSDGVSTVVSSETLTACVINAISAESAAENIVKMALRNDTDDNSTAVVASLNWEILKAHVPRKRPSGKSSGGMNLNIKPPKMNTKTIAIALVIVVAIAMALGIGILIGTETGGGVVQTPAPIEQGSESKESEPSQQSSTPIPIEQKATINSGAKLLYMGANSQQLQDTGVAITTSPVVTVVKEIKTDSIQVPYYELSFTYVEDLKSILNGVKNLEETELNNILTPEELNNQIRAIQEQAGIKALAIKASDLTIIE